MAVITQEMGSLENDTIRFVVDINDGFNPVRLVAFRCINESDKTAYGEVVRRSDGLKYGATFLPRTTTAIPVLTTVANRITGTWSAVKGRYHGWDGSITAG